MEQDKERVEAYVVKISGFGSQKKQAVLFLKSGMVMKVKTGSIFKEDGESYVVKSIGPQGVMVKNGEKEVRLNWEVSDFEYQRADSSYSFPGLSSFKNGKGDTGQKRGGSDSDSTFKIK